ncbi:unnamed protein product [Candidula unifasciata]|uniref:Uncharacterized protein n=1 Tax=Candidula unifasciata TaxID=100452 RepID=A0A8S3ZUY8_9EUPU|nr:unnamed protein product [Candidula unifasciata]
MARWSYTVRTVIHAWIFVSVTSDICPYKECQCVEGLIECEDLNLKSMPTLVVNKVSFAPYLALSRNSITSVPDGSLPSGLGGVDFEGNPLTDIGQQVFVGSSDTLTTLKFSNVNLSEFPFALLYLGNLQHLSIKDSQIQQWDISVWASLGNTLKDVTLVNVGITNWPDWIPVLPLLTSLEFSSAIVSIPDDAFRTQAQNMLSLTLRNVTMTSTSSIFSILPALTDLILDNNKISQLTGLPNFGRLTYLSLENNSIANTSHLTDALRPVQNSLRSLYMDGNKLTIFPDLLFMTSLDTIHLSNNLIDNGNTGAIPTSVSFLALENNRLTTLVSFLEMGTKLDTLQLHSNMLAELAGTDYPANVFEIDVSLNLLSRVTESCFPQNSKLETLRLDLNPISTVSVSAFGSLVNLRYLSMTNTRIRRLPVSMASLSNLITIDFRGNGNLVCTCSEYILRLWYSSNGVDCSGTCGLTSIDFFLRDLSAACPS